METSSPFPTIDEGARRRFESAWRAGRPEPIEQCLPPADHADYLATLEELVLIELEMRWRARKQPDATQAEAALVEGYLKRFPALQQPGRLARLVKEEYRLRRLHGDTPSADEYQRRFPELDGDATALARVLPQQVAVDRYDIVRELGRGGMGVVVMGHDRHMDRDLALKVLPQEHRGQPHLVRRFLNEARITGRLQHPCIVPVYDQGELPDRRPYFTMKLVQGRTLAVLLQERPDPTHDRPRFLAVFEQVCQAVAYAHSKGVIHRDLKPANVMVGAFGEVQVMDWGLAKVLGRGEGQPARPEGEEASDPDGPAPADGMETLPGEVLGTPAYVAPEQARGEVERLDERGDVFGLGAILCEVLTGRPPFAGASSQELLARARAGDHAEALARLDACGAEGDLVRLTKGCLAAEPSGRPAGAGAVAAAMTAYLAGVQERLRRAELERTAAEARAGEERKRRRVSLALAAAVLALVAVGAGGGLWVQHQAAEHRADQARRDAEQRQAVEFALEKAAGLRQQAHWREAAAVLDQARQILGAAGPDDLRQRLDVAQAELALVNRLDAIRQRRAMLVEGKFDTRTAEHDYAAAFREAGLGQVGDDEAAVAAQVAASEVAGPLVAALDDWAFVAEEARSISWLLGVARRADPDPWRERFHDPTMRQDRRALQALADDALRDDGAKLDELSPQVLGSLGALLGGGADAVPLLRAAQRRYPNDFWLGLKLGNALWLAKQAEEAVSYFRVAVALRPDAAAAHSNLGVALAERKDLDGAIAEFRTAIALDPKDANSHYNLGVALYVKRDVDGAIAELRKAIDLAPKHAYAHHNLGNALAAKDDLDGAIAEYKKAIDFNPRFAGAHGGLGTALRARQDLDGAIAEFRKTIDLDPKDALAHINLGNALRDRQDLDGAIAEFHKAVDIDPKLAPGHYSLGIALSDKQDLDGAIAEFRKATDLDPNDASARYNLGIALYVKKNLGEAIAELRKATDFNPKFAYAHGALGQALLDQGRFAEARTATRRCLELLPQRDPFREAISQLLQECERLVALDEKLSAVLHREAEPADAAERLALGQLCQQYKHRHAAAVRFYTDAFAADPKLANDLQSQQRYNAACSAALAAAGQAEDAQHLPDKVVVMLRRQALAWLRADLALYTKLAEGDGAAAKQAVRQRLAHWQQNSDLASVRDKGQLDRLPDDERRPWRALWDDVATLLVKVGATPP